MKTLECCKSASATSFFGGKGCVVDILVLRPEPLSASYSTAQSARADRSQPWYYARVLPASPARPALQSSLVGRVGVCVALETPSPLCVVPPSVFDAFGWCESDWLEWRRPASAWDDTTALDGSDPARMVFVLRRHSDLLPTELASVHAFGLGLVDERALAPWAIDDATDSLYGARVRPGDLLWLAADNLNALFWGLHDWAHFHNHGPFLQRAWTELQCDATALGWMWLNRDRIPIDAARFDRLRKQAQALSEARFAAEGVGFDGRMASALDVLEMPSLRRMLNRMAG